ncbi:MAG TPA: hypothetical protein VGK29_00680 [Paludibaculum sp.]|jgi:hypothetical protein
MQHGRGVRRAVIAVGLLSGLAVAGDWADVTPKRTGDYDANKASGYCTIRVRVDIETIVHLRGEKVAFETLAGRPSTDEGTECSQPLPGGNALANFKFRGVDGRGEQTLLEAPGAENSWTAKIRIRDPKGGDEGYTGRIEWDNRGGPSKWESAGWRGPADSSLNNAPPSSSTPSSGAGWGGNSGNSGVGYGGAGYGGAAGGEFSGTVVGLGRFEQRNGPSSDITEARVDLMRNGDFRLELRGIGASYDLGGRWSRRGDSVALEITQGLRNAGASGQGTVELRGDRIVGVSVSGVTARGNGEFRAELRQGGAVRSGWGNPVRGENRNGRAFSASSTGLGSFWVTNGRQMSLSEARLEVNANGEAMLEFRGQSSPSFYGRIENQGMNDVTIRVMRIANAEASGTIRVQMMGGQIDRAEGRVRARTGEELNVNFRR